MSSSSSSITPYDSSSSPITSSSSSITPYDSSSSPTTSSSSSITSSDNSNPFSVLSDPNVSTDTKFHIISGVFLAARSHLHDTHEEQRRLTTEVAGIKKEVEESSAKEAEQKKQFEKQVADLTGEVNKLKEEKIKRLKIENEEAIKKLEAQNKHASIAMGASIVGGLTLTCASVLAAGITLNPLFLIGAISSSAGIITEKLTPHRKLRLELRKEKWIAKNFPDAAYDPEVRKEAEKYWNENCIDASGNPIETEMQ